MAFHETAAGIESVATTVALLSAGGWALWTFGLKRESFPHAKLQHTFMAVELDVDRRFVRVDLTVQNIGSKLLRIESITSRLQQVMPLVAFGDGIFKPEPTEKDGEVQWPMIKECKRSFGVGEREIEPGESDTFQFDYIISQSVATIQAYSYVCNSLKRKGAGRRYHECKEIGWNATDIHRLTPPGRCA